MKESNFTTQHTQHNASSANGHVRLIVPGMGGDHCAGIITTSLKRLSGVTEVRTNIAAHRVEVRFDPGQVDSDSLEAAVEHAGYEVAQVEKGNGNRDQREARLTMPGDGERSLRRIMSSTLLRSTSFMAPAERNQKSGCSIL